MPAIVIRTATLADVGEAAPLFDLCRQFYEMEPDAGLARRFIHERLANGQSALFLAEGPDGATGFCQLFFSFCSVFAGPICILNDLFVLPSARGSGIGKALLRHAEAFAAQTGAVRITLQTARTNRRAQELYENEGWVRNTTLQGYSKRFG